MKPATASVRIKAPRTAVHALLADLSRHQEYLDHFLVDWAITGGDHRGVGATARLRPKGGPESDTIDIEMTAVGDDEIVIDTRSGRRGNRHMRLVYTVGDVVSEKTRKLDPEQTQVTLSLELVQGSTVDKATWSVPRAHLERQYMQGMLRLKGLLEGPPA